MSSPASSSRYQAGAIYRMRMNGYLDEMAFDYIDDLTLSVAIGPDQTAITTLVCRIEDEAMLMGIINTLYDFGLKILSIECLPATPGN